MTLVVLWILTNGGKLWQGSVPSYYLFLSMEVFFDCIERLHLLCNLQYLVVKVSSFIIFPLLIISVYRISQVLA